MQKGLQKEIVNFEIKFRISSPHSPLRTRLRRGRLVLLGESAGADRGEDFGFRIYYERRNYDTTLHAS